MDTKDQAAVGREQAGPDGNRQEPVDKKESVANQPGAGEADAAATAQVASAGRAPAPSSAPADVAAVDAPPADAASPASKAPPTHEELVEQVIDTIVTEGMIDREKVTPDATIESLDLKSIDIVMILTALEDKFDVYIPMDGPFHDAKNVKDLIDAIATYIMKEKQA